MSFCFVIRGNSELGVSCSRTQGQLYLSLVSLAILYLLSYLLVYLDIENALELLPKSPTRIRISIATQVFFSDFNAGDHVII